MPLLLSYLTDFQLRKSARPKKSMCCSTVTNFFDEKSRFNPSVKLMQPLFQRPFNVIKIVENVCHI